MLSGICYPYHMGKPEQQTLGTESDWWQQLSAREWLRAEHECALNLLGPVRGQQVLELIPRGMPSLSLPEADLITWQQQDGYWRQPVHAPQQLLPVVDHCLDGLIWRYLALRHHERMALAADAHRCLRPGGFLLVVSLNPLQPQCWRACGLQQLSLQALDMSWPLRIQGFRTEQSSTAGGRRLLRPVRLLLLRKPGDPRIIHPLHNRFMKSVKQTSTGTVPSCRAA